MHVLLLAANYTLTEFHDLQVTIHVYLLICNVRCTLPSQHDDQLSVNYSRPAVQHAATDAWVGLEICDALIAAHLRSSAHRNT